MVQRVTNPNRNLYEYYGGRGIKICDRWRVPYRGYRNFLEDMGLKPSPAHSLDRVDPNGNYEPSNCRWASKTEQLINQRLRTDNTSGYRGVYWDKNRCLWMALITVKGSHFHVGRFSTIEEAAWMRDQWAIELHGENFAHLNFDYI